MGFFVELWRFMRVRKKFWLAPILFMDGRFRRVGGIDQGLRGRAVHVYVILIVSRMRVLGTSAFYHDSAAALVENGRIVAAAQEERITRKKHDSSFSKKRHRLLSRGSSRKTR